MQSGALQSLQKASTLLFSAICDVQNHWSTSDPKDGWDGSVKAVCRRSEIWPTCSSIEDDSCLRDVLWRSLIIPSLSVCCPSLLSTMASAGVVWRSGSRQTWEVSGRRLWLPRLTQWSSANRYIVMLLSFSRLALSCLLLLGMLLKTGLYFLSLTAI